VQTVLALLLALSWATALELEHWHGDGRLLDRAEGVLTDLRLLVRGTRPAPDLLTIVAIDDDTAGKKGGYPLPRAELAGIVEGIARHKPRVIAIDLLLLDQGKDNGDAALAQALAMCPATIAAAAVFSEASQLMDATDDNPLARLPRAEKFVFPLAAFADHATV